MRQTILLTGATGYVGGRLLRRLEELGYRVRCIARRPEYLRGRISPATEVSKGDVLDRQSLIVAMKGVETAYYLVHSMGSPFEDMEKQDRRAALDFGRVAKQQGVRRIVYLGGLGDSATNLSRHLRSRQLVGKLLGEAGVSVVEFRASLIVGSGSLSFEIIRALVERLPVIICSRWMTVEAQPVAIADVLDYLCGALEVNARGHSVFEIGGRDRTTFAGLMQEYAKQRGLRRLMVSVPILAPRLSSIWLGLVTPVYARIGRKLIESTYRPAVVMNQEALRAFEVHPKGLSDIIGNALRNEDREFAETHWWHSLSAGGTRTQWGGKRFGNRLVYQRRVAVNASPDEAFSVIQRVGGQNGWYYANWLWALRGFIDLLAGGVGLRRARAHPFNIRVGDVIDWWRVESYEPGSTLLLQAEMKLPGRAWLELSVENHKPHPKIVQTAIFDPVGLLGLAYWYGIYPLHSLVFRGMLRNMSRAAERTNAFPAAG